MAGITEEHRASRQIVTLLLDDCFDEARRVVSHYPAPRLLAWEALKLAAAVVRSFAGVIDRDPRDVWSTTLITQEKEADSS